MNALEYMKLILVAVERQKRGDTELLNTISLLCEEADKAKQLLRDKGYGVTGTGLLETCKEVPAHD